MTDKEVQKEISDTLSRIDADVTRLLAMVPVGTWGDRSDSRFVEVWELADLRNFQILRAESRDGE